MVDMQNVWEFILPRNYEFIIEHVENISGHKLSMNLCESTWGVSAKVMSSTLMSMVT